MSLGHMTDIALLAFHIVAVISGWLVLFKSDLMHRTSNRFFNLSPEYLKYAVVTSTTASSSLFILLHSVDHFFPGQVGGLSLLWKLQTVGSALSFCLVHFYFFRIRGVGIGAGKGT